MRYPSQFVSYCLHRQNFFNLAQWDPKHGLISELSSRTRNNIAGGRHQRSPLSMLSTMVRYHSGRSLSTLHVQISVTVPTSPHSRQSPPISVEGDFGISCPMTMPMDSVRNDFPLTETLRSSFLAIEATDGANLGLPIRRGRSMGPMRAPNLSFFTRRSSRLIFCIHARQTARYSFRSIMHRPRGREEQTVQHPRDVTPSAHGL